ncbi:MAG: hypothetical protein ACP5I8_07790 [Phycisphaerae bacterium]
MVPSRDKLAFFVDDVHEITARAILFVVISVMATSAFPLLLASADAATVSQPAARPNVLLSPRQRFATAKSYYVYFGSGHVAKLACYNVVILHAPTMAHPNWPSMSVRDVHRLNQRGVVTLGYLSVGESTGLLRGDGQGPGGYASWYFNGGNGRPLEDTQWHSFPVNCGNPAWRERILRHAAWLINQRGFEGLFLDTAYTYYAHRHTGDRIGTITLIRELRTRFPAAPIVVNEPVALPQIAPWIDGVVLESFTLGHLSNNTTYIVRSPAALNESLTVLRNRIAPVIRKHPLRLLAIDYALPYQKGRMRMAADRAATLGLLDAICPIDFNKIYAPVSGHFQEKWLHPVQ